MLTHLQPLRLSNLHHAPPNHLLGGPRELQLQAVILERPQLLRPGVIADADDGNLGNLDAACVSTPPRKCTAHMQGQPTLMVCIRSATPPRSPLDMPSTSSMMRTCRLGVPSKFTAVLVTISLTMFAILPAMPPFTSASDCTPDSQIREMAGPSGGSGHSPFRAHRWRSPPSRRSPGSRR